MKKLPRLFWELFKISLFVIGGGYAIIVVADAVFAKLKWTEEGELFERLPVFQMVPGLIATHTAVYVGRKVDGWRGAAVGVLAVALPSIVIFTFVSAGVRSIPEGNLWLESAFVGLRAALTGVIAATIVKGWRRNLPDVFAYALMTAALAAMVCGVSVWMVLVAAMAVGLVSYTRDRNVASTKTFQSSWLALLLFLKYGALCFGGGFVLVPMYIEDFVGPDAAFLQVTAEEFSNLMALTQMTPGPIGVNGATYFGYRLAGVAGAVFASLALLLPGSVLCYAALSSMERFRTSRVVCGILHGTRPASVALMLVALAAFARMCLFHRDGSFGVTALLLVIATTLLTMKKKLSPMILVFLCTLAATALRADDSITCEKYPDADSVVVDEQSRVKYNPDGTYDETSESWTKILTEKGRREESVCRLDYSKRYGSAEIVSVSIIGTDGVERTVDVSATTNDSTDNSSMSANIYDPLDRRIVCTVPGLKVGETLHVKTRSTSFKPRCENTWADLSVFEWTSPIIRASVEITAPKERPLKRIAIRHPLGNVTSSTRPGPDGSTVHCFVCTNSPQAFPEPDMSALYTQVQHLLVSTANDWPELSRWYWELCAPHLAKTNAAMSAKVRELTEKKVEKAGGGGEREMTEDEKIRAIFKFVSQEVRYMGLTMEDTSPGYAPHDVDITFDNRYGVCRDKAGLLVAMLRMAGFEAFPVLIHVGPKQDKEVPKPFFNHAIVGLEEKVEKIGGGGQRRYLLMDPTNENAKDLLPASESDKSYLVARPDGEDLRTTPTPSSEHNVLKAVTRATLEKDGAIFLESELDFNGINDTLYRGAFVKMKPEDRVKFFEKTVKSLAAGAELVRCEVEPRDMRDTDAPVRVTLAARMPEMVMRGETRNELTVPFITKSLGAANFLLEGSTSLEKRRFDLKVSSTASVDETVEVSIGESLGRVLTLPDEISIKGGYEFDRSFSCKDGTLRAHRRVAVTKVTFEPEEYAALREDIKRTEAAERRRPVFERDPLAEADVHWLDESSEVDIQSERAWTVTNRISKEILTYSGKKGSAELKFGYNPCVERVDLVSAVVSNRNGTVAVVTPKEMNVMDCGWAASAPRYPASKLLVVNLPSVEIGSVISYTVVHTVTNAAASYYGTFGFDSQEPLDRRYVRVNGWTREVRNPKRIPNEPGQPLAIVWRDREIVTSNDFTVAAATLRKANEGLCVAASEGGATFLSLEKDLPSASKGDATFLSREKNASSTSRILFLRNWMARHVRIAGPSLWELPLDLQLTSPSVVLKERYATRLDYIRTLVALLRAAGYTADIVYATNDAGEPEELRMLRKSRELHRCNDPDVRAFSLPLCRVTVREGGFLGFFADEKVYFLGTENEYSPLGVCGLEGCTFFDPETAAFGTVTVPFYNMRDYTSEETEIDIRENGAVDMTVTTKIWGSGVGAFRKRYAEILPEDRSRLYQTLLGSIAQAATATSDLETDIAEDCYPAKRKFSCFIPDYAMVTDGAITLQLPPLLSSIPTFVGKARKTPFAVDARDPEAETVTIRFPEGYTVIEHLPEEFRFVAPGDSPDGDPWLSEQVSSSMVDGRLEVRIERYADRRVYSWYEADVIELVKERNRIATSRSNRTIVVRK